MFDSGIGGLSILKVLLCQRPDLDLYYWADDAYTPYGSRSDEAVLARCHLISQSFVDMGVSLIVVACNTATAIAIEDLRASFQGVTFVGIEPYVNVINHIPWQAEHRAVILTTPLTGRSERFCRLKSQLDPQHQLEHFSCPELAKIVETAFWQYENPEHLREQVHQELLPILNRHYQYAILGCTHYPLVGRYIQDVLNAEVISPCKAVSRQVLSLLHKAPLPYKTVCEAPYAEGRVAFHFYRSSMPQTYQRISFNCHDLWPAL